MKSILPECFRLANYAQYIEKQNKVAKASDTCILILAYNQIEAVKEIARFLLANKKRNQVDILIVDNNSNDGTYEYLLAEYSQDFNFLKLTENFGGAGGFAVGQEFVIANGYDYCLISEEDAMPLDNDILDEMLKYKSPTTRVMAKFYELETNSFTLHFNLYPVKLFQVAGVMNFDLFFRSDDLEYEYRIKQAIKSLNFNIQIVDKRYTHSILKAGFGVGANYFGLRNRLFVVQKYFGSRRLFNLIQATTVALVSAIFALFHDGNNCLLKQFWQAVCDFMGNKLENKSRFTTFKGNTLKPEVEVSLKSMTFKDFGQTYANYKAVGKVLHNKLLQDYLRYDGNEGIISAKFNGARRVVSFWHEKIIFVEQLDFVKQEIKFFSYRQNKLLMTRLFIVLSFILAAVGELILLPFLIYKLVY